MAKEQKSKDDIIINPNGQSGQLEKIIKSTKKIVLVGGVLLVLFIIVNIYLNRLTADQLESTMYLNQYRLGSKALTSAVQSYAVTGDKTYYDEYMQEYIRYVITGRHYKGNYRITYRQLKAWGYRSLVHEYYSWKKL